MDTQDQALLPAAKVRELEGGISDMTLWRRLNDPQLGFPRPIFISTRRYWDAREYWNYRAKRLATRDRMLEVA